MKCAPIGEGRRGRNGLEGTFFAMSAGEGPMGVESILLCFDKRDSVPTNN